VYSFFFFFFFSSRRRHTRFSRDWRDVCSSDLKLVGLSETFVNIILPFLFLININKRVKSCFFETCDLCISVFTNCVTSSYYTIRSEERRVGKECKWSW